MEEAITLAGDRRGAVLLPDLLMLRGRDIHERFGDMKAAHRDFESALAGTSNGSKHRAAALLGLARTAPGGPASSLAAQSARSALKIARDLRDRDLEAVALATLSAHDLAHGRTVEAHDHARRAVALMQLASEYLADDEVVALRSDADRASLLHALLSAAWSTGDEDDLFQAMEACRGHALLGALGGASAARGMVRSPEARARERDARAELWEADALLQELIRSDAAFQEVRAARQRVDAAEQHLVSVVSSLQRGDLRQAVLAGWRTVDRAAFVRALPDNAVALHIALAPGGVLVLRSGHGGSKATRWPLRVATELSGSALWPRSRAADREGFLRALDEFGKRVRSALPAGTRHVLVCPDGVFASLPWPAIASRTLPAVTIHVFPSAATYRALVKVGGGTSKRATRALLVGDPVYADEKLPVYIRGHPPERLKGSGDEVRAIRRAGDVLLVREQATESKVRSLLAEPEPWRLVHLACHGVVDPVLPSMSSLALGRTEQHDGFLTALEVAHMRVDAQFAVLSACNVGHDAVVNGEGMLGLVRAFMAAGVPRVLASLWPADDQASAALMKRFHAETQSGRPNADALRIAQAAVRDQTDADGGQPWSHPYFWAGWVLWGLADAD
jgi:hypothetical protein